MTKDFVMKTLARWINAKYELWNYEVVYLENEKKAQMYLNHEIERLEKL